MWNRLLLAGLPLALLPLPNSGGTVQLVPSKDNTLFEPDLQGDRSNGIGPQFYAGRVGGFGGAVGLRRGVLAFDVAAGVPAGSIIQSVTLSVNCSRVPALDHGNARVHRLHRATSDWGEAASDAGINAGVGAAPATGDATWSHTFFSTLFWGTAGGDFSGTVSSTIAVPNTGLYVFPSTPALVADVQSMLDTPGSNFGWVVTGEEVASGTARAFDTREAPTYPLFNGTAPVLEITYTGPAPVPALGVGGVAVLALLALGSGAWVLSRRTS